MFDPDRYGVSLRKATVDGEDMFVATVKELPDVLVLESSSEAALRAVREVIAGLYEASLRHRKAFPEPVDENSEYSGRVTLRMTSRLHRDVDQIARSESQSLNAVLNEIIARAVGEINGRRTVLRSQPDAFLAELQNILPWSGAVRAEAAYAVTASRAISTAEVVANMQQMTLETSDASLFDANGIH